MGHDWSIAYGNHIHRNWRPLYWLRTLLARNWRVKSKKVMGQISAVKEQGKYYHAVFKHNSPDGRTYEQDSTLGSSSILKRLPGTKLHVMIRPDNPEKIRRPTFIWLLFGSVFLVPGLFIMNLAIKKFEFNYMVALFILAIILFGGEKLFKIYKKINHSKFDRTLLKEAWQDIKNGRNPKSKLHDVKGKILENHEILKKVKAHLKYSKLTALFLVLISAGLLWGAYYTGQNMIELTQNGIVTEGTVHSIESDSASDGSGYTYYASIKFIALNDQEYHFKDSIGSSKPLYKVGEQVNVLYLPRLPGDAIIDHGLLNWGIPIALVFIALWSLWGSTVFLKAKRRFKNTPFYSTIQVRP